MALSGLIILYWTVRPWWHMSFILALGRQRQTDFCAFKVGLAYKLSYRTARVVKKKNPVS